MVFPTWLESNDIFVENWNFELKFFWWILFGKNDFYVFCLKCPKTFSHFVAKSTVTVYFLGIFDPFLDRKLIQNTLDVIFSLKKVTKKNSAQNSNFQQKWWWRHLVAKQLQKFFDLWSTQKYSKVSKICSACAGIFFRVTHMFKPTVS